jgi:hypothetical protein
MLIYVAALHHTGEHSVNWIMLAIFRLPFTLHLPLSHVVAGNQAENDDRALHFDALCHALSLPGNIGECEGKNIKCEA